MTTGPWRGFRQLSAACALLALAGCGSAPSFNVWPFGESGPAERSRVPANATAYDCAGGRKLFVRYQDNGASAWVILPEREFRLDRDKAAPGARYTNGSAVLEVNGKEAVLNDGPAIALTGCKAP